MISFQHVCKRYPGGRDAIHDVSFDIAAGEMAFVTGHSGAGKSTLLKLVSRVESATRGQIRVNGQDLQRLRNRHVPPLRRQIGMVFQDHRLLPARSVFDNVALPLVIAGEERSEIAKRVRAALDKVGLLDRDRALPAMLSAGEQQRVGIARAIVGKPALIIADEPTGNLDPQLAVEVMNLFVNFQQVGTAVLIASHDLHLIRHMGKRVLVLDGGRLIDDFRPVAD